MLDRYGEPTPTPAERAQAIADCALCNDDGYRGSTVCDHIDRAAAAKRGMDMLRHTMGWK